MADENPVDTLDNYVYKKSLCPHGKRSPYSCRECNGKQFCPCGVRKSRCPVPGHGGKSLCCQKEDGSWNRRDRCPVHRNKAPVESTKDSVMKDVLPHSASRPCMEHNRSYCRMCEPIAYLRRNYIKKINSCFRARGFEPPQDPLAVLGCSWEELYLHLVAKCLQHNTKYPHRPSMCIANIENDHIKPLSQAKTYEELLQLWHFTNIQPLFHEDNNSKNNRWGQWDDIFWRANIYLHPEYVDIYMPGGCVLATHVTGLTTGSKAPPMLNDTDDKMDIEPDADQHLQIPPKQICQVTTQSPCMPAAKCFLLCDK